MHGLKHDGRLSVWVHLVALWQQSLQTLAIDVKSDACANSVSIDARVHAMVTHRCIPSAIRFSMSCRDLRSCPAEEKE